MKGLDAIFQRWFSGAGDRRLANRFMRRHARELGAEEPNTAAKTDPKGGARLRRLREARARANRRVIRNEKRVRQERLDEV